MTQLSLGGLGGIVLAPDVLEEQRGAWCSPPEWTERCTERGPFDVDAFTNPRSTLKARLKCMLERGDDGFGLDKRSTPGTFYINPEHCTDCAGTGSIRFPFEHANVPVACPSCGYQVADEETTFWFQPPYDIVLEALAHYGHARFTALLRLDTSTVWFQLMFWGIATPEEGAKLAKALKRYAPGNGVCPPLCEVVMVPRRERVEFVPPPGVPSSTNPYPHGLYYKRAADVPPAVQSECYAWPTSIYPWDSDPLKLRQNVSARWRLFEHAMVNRQKLERPVMALHLARVVGTGTEDEPACGMDAKIAPCDQMAGFALSCTRCLEISELATVTALR